MQVQRLPGLPSSHTGIDTILNRDETIDFEDYLGSARACTLHHRHCGVLSLPHPSRPLCACACSRACVYRYA